MTTWISDDNDNQASVELWGSEDKAREALESCVGCSRCVNCSGCSNTSDDNRTFDVPAIENIHQRLLEAITAGGNLDMSDWHKCDTTHCRAGWIVHLAGDRGYALERQTSPLFAAQKIYKASGYEISPVRFFDSNEKAMADIRRLAEQNQCGFLPVEETMKHSDKRPVVAVYPARNTNEASKSPPAILAIDLHIANESFDSVSGLIEQYVEQGLAAVEPVTTTPRGDLVTRELQPLQFVAALSNCDGLPLEIRGSKRHGIYELGWIAQADIGSITESPIRGVLVRYNVEQE